MRNAVLLFLRCAYSGAFIILFYVHPLETVVLRALAHELSWIPFLSDVSAVENTAPQRNANLFP
jgi:hypothetical protein